MWPQGMVGLTRPQPPPRRWAHLIAWTCEDEQRAESNVQWWPRLFLLGAGGLTQHSTIEQTSLTSSLGYVSMGRALCVTAGSWRDGRWRRRQRGGGSGCWCVMAAVCLCVMAAVCLCVCARARICVRAREYVCVCVAWCSAAGRRAVRPASVSKPTK